MRGRFRHRSLLSACRLAAAALTVVLLAACGDATTVTVRDVELGGERIGDVTVLVAEPQDAGMDALAGGPLEVVGGCLGVGGSVVVWPHGTDVVEEDPLTIEIPDNGTFALGDPIEVGGGYVLEHSSDDVAPGPVEIAGVTVPEACASHDIWVAS